MPTEQRAKFDTPFEIAASKIAIIVSVRRTGRENPVSGTGGAVLASSDPGARKDQQPSGPKHSNHIEKRLTPEHIVLEALTRDGDVKARIRQVECMARLNDVHTIARGDIDTNVLAAGKHWAYSAIDIGAADLDDPRTLEEAWVVLLDGPNEFTLLEMGHDCECTIFGESPKVTLTDRGPPPFANPSK